ncbi:VOC family protein [Nonomuraea angiospora]|uniref:VOC family protein n=1 Tax=Nonomuraea angiospora TaxID=46172 RepID=UPI0029A4C4F1|nr:VOC family protein [Nonomuraea angiospora]MDX3100130.1 VOC family protein [Nonomuraea angiospora]
MLKTNEERAAMTPPFIFMDLRTPDTEASRRFYTELFSWTVADVPAGPASVPMFVDAEGPWGGFTPLAADDARPPQWIPYAPVTRLDDAARRATELGATVVRPRVDFPAGSVIVIQDPNGATIALWEAHA